MYNPPIINQQRYLTAHLGAQAAGSQGPREAGRTWDAQRAVLVGLFAVRADLTSGLAAEGMYMYV